MRPTPDIGIGRRAAEEVLKRMGDTPAGKYMESLGLQRGVIWEWQNGSAPAATSLQKLALAGFDVAYILTGNKMDIEGIQKPRWIPWKDRMGEPDGPLPYLGVFCSACDKHSDNPTNYCPNCGAKMEVDHETG